MNRFIVLFLLAGLIPLIWAGPVWAGPKLEDLINDADDVFLVQVEKKAECSNAYHVTVLDPFQRSIPSNRIVIRSVEVLKPNDKLFLFLRELKTAKECAMYEVQAHSIFALSGKSVRMSQSIELPIFLRSADANGMHVVPEEEWTNTLRMMIEGC